MFRCQCGGILKVDNVIESKTGVREVYICQKCSRQARMDFDFITNQSITTGSAFKRNDKTW